MPQYTSFTIQPKTIRSAAESVTACKGKILNLADSVNVVRGGLAGQTEALDMMGSVLGSIHDHMVYHAEQVNRLGVTAAWCAGTYDNADKSLLGLPQSGLAEPGLPPVRPKAAPYSMAQILSEAQRETKEIKERAIKAAEVKAAEEQKKKSSKETSTKKGTKEVRWIKNYTEKPSVKWNALDYSSKGKHYKKALVEFTTVDGVTTEKVLDHEGEVSEAKTTFSILGTGKRSPESGTIMSDWQKAASDLGTNSFKSQDPDKDLSNRVWQTKEDPNDPNKKKLTKLDKEEKEKNKFSKDLLSVGIVDWGRSVNKSVLSDGVESKTKTHELGASYAVLSGEAKASAGLGYHIVEKDGQKYHAVGLGVEGGVSGTVFKADANAKGKVTIGEDFELIGAGVKGDVKVGHAEAGAGVKARFMPEKGLEGIEVAADASAGLYAAKAKATGAVTALGVEASGSAEVNVGIGATGKIGLTGGKIRCELGLSLGVGVKLNFNLDVSNAMKGVKTLLSKW